MWLSLREYLKNATEKYKQHYLHTFIAVISLYFIWKCLTHVATKVKHSMQ